MQETLEGTTLHPLAPADEKAIAALRALTAPNKGRLRGAAARQPYDAIMNQVPAPDDVTYIADTVAGVAGFWCRPAHARSGHAIMHVHGGWFTFGSASAFRHFVGHIALRAGVAAFIPEYRLAPEHPFPAALDDVRACYVGLAERGIGRIALVGDSAGGGLALALSSSLDGASRAPAAVVALSPVTDLTLSGASWETRASADPYFTRDQAIELIEGYLGDRDRSDPLASALHADPNTRVPIRVHVGTEEVLLDDSLRYVKKARTAGGDASVEMWEGMPHGFVGGVGRLEASTLALDAIATFLESALARA